MIYVVIGVSGSGKTTIGALLAKQQNCLFADADDYHPESNKQKLAAGHPLTDEDRRPWLQTLNSVLVQWFESETDGVLACSALKESYRAILSTGLPKTSILFILLDLPREVLAARLATRKHPFMNPTLLDSQLATLERPRGSNVLFITLNSTPEAVVADIVRKLADRTDGKKEG